MARVLRERSVSAVATASVRSKKAASAGATSETAGWTAIGSGATTTVDTESGIGAGAGISTAGVIQGVSMRDCRPRACALWAASSASSSACAVGARAALRPASRSSIDWPPVASRRAASIAVSAPSAGA